MKNILNTKMKSTKYLKYESVVQLLHGFSLQHADNPVSLQVLPDDLALGVLPSSASK